MTTSRSTRRRAALAAALVVLALNPLEVLPSTGGDVPPDSTPPVGAVPSVLPPRWNPCQEAITYRVNVDAASSTAAGRVLALRDVQRAVALTSAATGMRFRYVGPSHAQPSGPAWDVHTGDAELLVAWVDPARSPASLLGRTSAGYVDGTGGYSYHYWTSGGSTPTRAVIDRGYVVLNAARRQVYASGFGAGVTRGELLLHELGHAMGLAHTADRSQIMFHDLLRRPRAAFGSGDLLELRRHGRPAGCVTVPNSDADLS